MNPESLADHYARIGMPECDCSRSEVTRRRARNGATMYQRQCLRCGSGVGQFIRRSELRVDRVPDWDDTRMKRWGAELREYESSRRAAWWSWYNDYLASEEWRTIRRRVMERADGICEGCGAREAMHVHHLTYARVGREMLFDLVAVCERCHREIHGDETEPDF